MASFAPFDARHYPTVSVRDGYGGWAATYEDTVEDAMDLALLERVSGVPWAAARRVADVGCGTGRTGAWLSSKGAAELDGVDLTPEMLALARARGIYRRLLEAPVDATGLEGGAYDLVTCCLVDEHLERLEPLYAEARRLLRPDSRGGPEDGERFFVLVGYHPFFLMASGMPTHFDDGVRGPLAIETHVHLPSEHVAAGRGAGFDVVEMHEGLVDEEWIRKKPRWAQQRGWPVSFVWVWRARAGASPEPSPKKPSPENGKS